MEFLNSIDSTAAEFGDLYDELPLWSARFGLLLLDCVRLQPGITILDVGAGTGFLAIELAQRCGAATRVIAVDPWQAAIERLRRKVGQLGVSNLESVVEEIASLRLADESVDLVVSNLGINNFNNPAAALEACFRFAKPGAEILLTTNLVGHMAEFYEVFRSVLTAHGDAAQVAALDTHINGRATVEGVQEMLENAGFRFAGAVTHTFQDRYVDGSSLLRHFFVRLGFLPAWISVLGMGPVQEVFEILERQLNIEAAHQGQLSLSIPAACIRAFKP